MNLQRGFFTVKQKRIFTAQYWFECCYCPRKQFAYTTSRYLAGRELEWQGWRLAPNTCPKCAKER